MPRDYNAPLTDSDNWPRLVQIAWQVHDEIGNLLEVENLIVKPEGFTIPYNAEKVHGISTEMALEKGEDLAEVLKKFNTALEKSEYVIGHNVEFDESIIGAEYIRKNIENPVPSKKVICTKIESTDFCAIPGGKGGRYKWPQLSELHFKLFNENFDEAHNASADVEATARVFLELLRLKVINEKHLKKDQTFIDNFIENNPNPIKPIGLDVKPYEKEKEKEEKPVLEIPDEAQEVEIESPFAHLHVHSQYSVLNSTASIKNIIDKAIKDKMPAIALTDQGNMYGAFSFVSTARKNKIKPIVGSEFNICKNHQDKTKKDNGYFQVLLAKNHQGYKNLIKLSSVSFSEGFYYVPRIDREVLLKYKENLIALTGNLYSEIPYLILNVGEQQAEEAFKWWHEQFGEDFYVELNRHGLEEENVVNETLIEFAKKYGVKVVAANNVFYINKEDADAQDILVCVQKGEYQSTPKGKGRGFRPGLPNDEYYFKTQEEMKALFADIPEAISNISDLINKVEEFDLYHEPIMPDFPLPEGFENEDEYLKHLTYEGAKDRYGEITDDIKERLDFELETIKKMGIPDISLLFRIS